MLSLFVDTELWAGGFQGQIHPEFLSVCKAQESCAHVRLREKHEAEGGGKLCACHLTADDFETTVAFCPRGLLRFCLSPDSRQQIRGAHTVEFEIQVQVQENKQSLGVGTLLHRVGTGTIVTISSVPLKKRRRTAEYDSYCPAMVIGDALMQLDKAGTASSLLQSEEGST